MTQNEFNVVLEQQYRKCADMLAHKKKEYTGDRIDRLNAFKILQQFRFLLDHCQKYQQFFSATGNGMAAAVLAERRHARLHRICFVIILIYSLPGQNVIHFRLAVMLMVRELIAR